MNEQPFTPNENGAASALASEPNEVAPEVLDLSTLQDLSPASLHELFARFNLRPHPDRTRHQLIIDLLRHAIARRAIARTSGFLEQPNDGPAMLRSPRLNFLPLPDDVGVPHHLIRHFGLRPGQASTATRGRRGP